MTHRGRKTFDQAQIERAAVQAERAAKLLRKALEIMKAQGFTEHEIEGKMAIETYTPGVLKFAIALLNEVESRSIL